MLLFREFLFFGLDEPCSGWRGGGGGCLRTGTVVEGKIRVGEIVFGGFGLGDVGN